MPRPVITLLTDFGQRDPFVGVMKGQILGRCADVELVDLTHEIPPQDVRSASFQLEQCVDYFPPGTIHLAVVDPGVGTDRAMLAVRTRTAMFVAPDNGLLTRSLRRLGPPLEIVRLFTPAGSSATFHGRDVMAPAAGSLAAGVAFQALGSPTTTLRTLDFPGPELRPDRIEASVLLADHFGNVTFDLSRTEGQKALPPGSRWQLAGREVTMHRTYAEVAPGEPLLLWSSHDLLELACRQGRADQLWSLPPGGRAQLFPGAMEP